jgi:excisionase family DNA binding protein
MRVSDAARVLGVSSSAVRNYCNQGRIIATRNPGGQRIITQDALDNFLGKKQDMANKKLPDYEYVSKVETITETDTGWVVTLRISGD